MRYFAFFILLGILLAGLSFYMATQVVNPLRQDRIEELISLRGYTKREEVYQEVVSLVAQGIIWDYLAIENIVPVITIMVASFASFFIGLHLFFDKLFFKEFYRPPSIPLALRRGLIAFLCLLTIIMLRFIGIQGFALLAPIPLAVAIEWVIGAVVSWWKGRREEVKSEK